MVRTKGDRVPSKAVGSKAPRKVVNATPKKAGSAGKGRSYSGGNPYCPRETPKWQKPITSFMNSNLSDPEDLDAPSSSKETDVAEKEDDTDEKED